MSAGELQRGATVEATDWEDEANASATRSSVTLSSDAGALDADGPPQSRQCQQCGRRARVHLLTGYARGGRVTQHYCLACACAVEAALCETEAPRRRFSVPAWAALTAAALAVAALAGDHITWPGRIGFGYYKQALLFASSLALLAGLLVRADLIAWGAGLLWVAVLYAGWVGPVRAAGFGTRQTTAVALSLGLILLGFFARALPPLLRRWRGHAPRQRPAPAPRPAEALG